jgi:hypothetical protein
MAQTHLLILIDTPHTFCIFKDTARDGELHCVSCTRLQRTRGGLVTVSNHCVIWGGRENEWHVCVWVCVCVHTCKQEKINDTAFSVVCEGRNVPRAAWVWQTLWLARVLQGEAVISERYSRAPRWPGSAVHTGAHTAETNATACCLTISVSKVG